MNTFLLLWLKPIWAGHSKKVVLEPVLIDGKVTGSMERAQCMGMCVREV